MTQGKLGRTIQFGLLGAVLAAVALGAHFGTQAPQAQQGAVVQPVPAPLGVTNASGSITTGGTFHSVFAAQGPQAGSVRTTTGAETISAPRRGCLIVNTSNTVAYVFFGALASATTPTSIPLNAASADGAAGGSVSCERDGAAGTIQSQISIVGATTAETFFAIRY